LGAMAFPPAAQASGGHGNNRHHGHQSSPVACSSLAFLVHREAKLNRNPLDPGGAGITAATPVLANVVPAAGPNPAYCRVVFQLKPYKTIQVGLPLNTVDGGSGGVQGAWNGRIRNMGSGGYSGRLESVTPCYSGWLRRFND
jgi:hypothetical protein